MDVQMINPFIEAISYIMPQLGFQSITKGKLSVGDQFMTSKGVTVLVGLTDEIRGNIAYNMTEETAMNYLISSLCKLLPSLHQTKPIP